MGKSRNAKQGADTGRGCGQGEGGIKITKKEQKYNRIEGKKGGGHRRRGGARVNYNDKSTIIGRM